jgi:pyruvate/2-oxoglutarate dehydrogenase complex dihydrolipoamide dehydrogenase (E3) component
VRSDGAAVCSATATWYLGSMTTWDALVVGAGQSGVPLAVALARAGRRTALVERADVGGTCINVGCTPTKTLVASARVASLAARAAEYGIQVPPPRTNWPAVRDREQGVVKDFRASGERRLRDAGVTLLRGEARFVGQRRLRVTGADGTAEEHQAPVVVLDTGGRPRRPELPGLDSVPALDSSSILTLGPFPERLLVLGGGYIALELGQIFRRLGAEVTIVESAPRLASREDAEISDQLADILRAEGIRVHVGARTSRVSPARGGVRLELADGTALEGTHLLVAVGRTPNTEALDCAAGGLTCDAHGFIQVDDRLRTTAEGVYATGDVTGAPQFTHVSYDDYRVLRAELLDGPPRSQAGRLVPYTLFTDPQLGRVGLTETEARAKGLSIRVARMPMSHCARAIESGETRGVLKAVVDAKTERILGFAALGFEGGELSSVVHTAMVGDLPWTILKDFIYPHPGLAESLNILFDSWV